MRTETQNDRQCGWGQVAEDLRRLGEDVNQMFRRMGPSEQASAHFRTARVEFLKGLRQVIDDRIDDIQKGPAPGTAGAGGARVTVE
jgi:uncharacterized protein YdeI (YjbR/CyaY-like superfamily)